jgi:hypothetical protein
MRSFIIIFILIFFAAAVRSQSAPLPSAFQSWNEVQLIAPLVRSKKADGKTNDKITAIFNGTFRFGRKSFDFIDARAGMMLDVRVNKYFSILAGGLYRREEIVKNVPRYETRIQTGANFSAKRGNFTFRDRNLYERRFRSRRRDLNVYRQRIQISYSVKRGDKELFAPFISEEGYYDLNLKTWFSNEFYVGISRTLSKKTSLDIAYVRNDTRPVNVNGLSLTLRIKLR